MFVKIYNLSSTKLSVQREKRCICGKLKKDDDVNISFQSYLEFYITLQR